MTAPEHPFTAPWQAQLFAMTVALNEAGAFPWSDWTELLGAELRRTDDYWQAWDAALEAVLARLGIAPAEVAALAERWQAAAAATPHGRPVLLRG